MSTEKQLCHHLGLITKDNETVNPLSNSPEPDKVALSAIEYDLPAFLSSTTIVAQL